MMINSTYSKLKHLGLFSFILILVSCGAQKDVGYDDGIYNENITPRTTQQPEEGNLNTEYYKNYFEDTAQEVEAITGEPEVFTDVEGYSSNYTNDSIPPQDFTGNGGWGDATTEVNINYYDNGWNNWAWGYGWNCLL